ncbi:hypothetical protein DFR55_1169 [Herbinix hemicellulosilytica]|uniref:Uncharacterized protein n=1 Tax=Herbinix hemicellulosilytica TaxID=1564487 RepID=A0A0H5ST48_HERHM|nr:hypothetical protein [Herbinix hemicellulosilytica]RBP57976.1 hypothetical protein DFR55_1169 [Herbinix hemicellulosilytica]CRZ33473.1 hypothetical protein HHT355_0261 [Herbinix hemicellulosilytica]
MHSFELAYSNVFTGTPTPSVSTEYVLEADPPPSIFVDGELYTFFDTEKGSRMNTDELDYLGSVIALTDTA